jgi:parvulin-like peptidyl-prolyl isomerase
VAWFVNGEQVDDEAVREEARKMRPQYMESIGPMDPIEAEMQLRDWARENVIERMLLNAAANADPEPVPEQLINETLERLKDRIVEHAGSGLPNVQDDFRKRIEQDYRMTRLLERVHAKVKPPSQGEIKSIYRRRQSELQLPDTIHAAHIVKNVDDQHDEASARASVEAAMAELESGAPFPEVADKYSDCPGNGGDLGWFARGQMVQEFDDVVFELNPGARSGIFRTQFGFHIATVFERRAPGPIPFKEVESDIREALLRDRQTKAVEEYIDALRAKAEIRQERASK